MQQRALVLDGSEVNPPHGVQTLVVTVVDDLLSDGLKNPMSLHRLGGEREAEGAQNSSIRGRRQGERSYSNKQQQDDRLTRQVCCNAIG